MKLQIETLIANLDRLIERAERMSDSDNEATAEKYTDCLDELNTAREALESAAASLE